MQDVDRFLIFPTSPIKIDFIQKVGKANIFAKADKHGFREIFDIKILHSSVIFQND